MRAILSLVRIGAGCLFFFLGAKKLLDPGFLYGGLMHALEAAGHPFPFYETFLNSGVERHQALFTFGVSIGELLLGISLLLGAYVSLSSVFGAILLVNIALATTYGNWLHFAAHLAGAVALLLLGRIGAGLTWGLDAWLVDRLPPALVLFPLRRSPPRRARAHS
jgi:uncharacterized membrane protein YphA (DoxX/SURF4 family)